MAGGSTYMPVVEQMLKEVCRREPSRDVIPEEAVAQGAAIHAAILEAKETGGRGRLGKAVVDRLRSVNTTDVNSHSLGVQITDPMDPTRKSNYIMIPKNTAIPYEVNQRFVTTSPNQRGFISTCWKGGRRSRKPAPALPIFRSSACRPGLPSGSPVDVTYSYDNNGRIQVTAVEMTGKKPGEHRNHSQPGIGQPGRGRVPANRRRRITSSSESGARVLKPVSFISRRAGHDHVGRL